MHVRIHGFFVRGHLDDRFTGFTDIVEDNVAGMGIKAYLDAFTKTSLYGQGNMPLAERHTLILEGSAERVNKR